MRELSDKQQRILGFIEEFMDDNGYPPTVRDIQAGCEISSTSVVDYNLRALREKGYINRDAEVSRGLQLVNGGRRRSAMPETIAIPLLGTVASIQAESQQCTGQVAYLAPGLVEKDYFNADDAELLLKGDGSEPAPRCAPKDDAADSQPAQGESE